MNVMKDDEQFKLLTTKNQKVEVDQMSMKNMNRQSRKFARG
ncbi:hypothetical protein [Sporosarcina obsidiansis]|nr:hypothetical protein [Sporosarcina obsidiansis]